jgi:hypothetical protein
MRWVFASLALVLCMSANPVVAQHRFELRWTAAEGTESCPGEGAIAAEIAVRLGRNPFTHGAEQELAVALSGAPGDWVAALSVHRSDGNVMWSRPLRSQDEGCYTLANAIVLAVVLMIDPSTLSAPAQEPAQEPSPGPSEIAPPERADPILEVPAPSAPAELPRNPRRELSASVSALVTGGVLPRIAGGVAVNVSGRIVGPLRWGAGMRLYPEVTTADANFAFGLTATSLGLCADTQLGNRFVLGGCAALLGGVVHGVVFNPEPTFPGDRFWLGLALDANAALRIVGPLWVGLEVGAVFSLIRQTFTIRADPQPVFQQDIAGLDASLSLVLRFP